ncbi:MAG: hypothetical protein QOF33_69 [Thermomicrobiales bacterium]|nr:hypothetical protein [Thermomicrobiales bacterium]MEA2581984.1 hypothetical protein [Thermomicrobiales bacterium]
MSTRGRKGLASRTANRLSLALFALAAILFVAVAVLYVRDRQDKDQTPPPPPSQPGHAQLKNVVDALRAQGIETEVSREPSPQFAALTPPAQGLTADGNPLYVFIYDDPTIREDESGPLEAADLLPESATGTIPSGEPHPVGGSNIYVVLFGGDAELAAKVDRAIQGLP